MEQKKQKVCRAYSPEAKELIRLTIEGRLSGFELAEKYFEMDQKRPNEGWAKAGRQIYNRWARKNKKAEI